MYSVNPRNNIWLPRFLLFPPSDLSPTRHEPPVVNRHIRHELLPSGRYVEARGKRERAYLGRYVVTGNHIDYWDDTGFTADGDFVDDVLHHAGMILYRDK